VEGANDMKDRSIAKVSGLANPLRLGAIYKALLAIAERAGISAGIASNTFTNFIAETAISHHEIELQTPSPLYIHQLLGLPVTLSPIKTS